MSVQKYLKILPFVKSNQLQKFLPIKCNLYKQNMPPIYATPRNFCTCDSEDDSGDSGDKNVYYQHRYDSKLESGINEQINAELQAWYAYMNIATYYGRSSVALPGCHGYFMKMCYEEHEHAMSFIRYQNLRGGKVQLFPIEPTGSEEWDNISDALCCALDLEKSVKEKLQKLYKLAENCSDTNVQDMLDPVVYDQENSICELARLVTRANYLEKTDVGKYLFDRELHETHVKIHSAPCKPEKGDKAYT